jgi:hypothetical protein
MSASTKKQKNEPKKRGTQSNFQGQRDAFLNAWIDEYMQSSRKKATPTLWPRIFAQYWMNFNWRLPLSEDPIIAFFVDTNSDWVAPELTKEDLTSDEETRKTALLKSTQKVCVFFDDGGRMTEI